MRIGVTGATGFIGSHLISALTGNHSNQVVALERKPGNMPLSLKVLKEFVQNKDIIYHLAGVNRGTDEELIQGNIQGTLNLIEAVKAHGSPSTHIIFASSTQVYKLTNASTPIRESRTAEPAILYGVTKKAAEDIIRLSTLPHTLLRLSNVYGPGCRSYYNSVIATFCDRAVNRLPLLINGDGSQGRDFLYIEDAIHALILAGNENKDPARKVFNVGSGHITSLKQVVEKISQAGFNPSVTYRSEEYSGDPSYCCDPSRFIKWTGWKPRVTLATGIRNTLKWIQQRTAA